MYIKIYISIVFVWFCNIDIFFNMVIFIILQITNHHGDNKCNFDYEGFGLGSKEESCIV